jgi:hypothetical protein
VGTTSPGGSDAAQHADWSPLAGKNVTLWPDNDGDGHKHMRRVAGILERLRPEPRLYWFDPATYTIPEKGDVADELEKLDPECWHEAVETFVGGAEPMGASRELRDMLEATISGERSAIGWPWKRVAEETWALLPGTLTLLCGDPGASKSFALLQAALWWQQLGEQVALFELEEDRPYHLNRLLSQVTKQSGFTNPEWVKRNPEEVRQEVKRHAEVMDAFGRCLYAAPDEQVDYKRLLAWIKERAQAGCRVVAIDPVTAVQSQRDTWVADSKFIFEAKTIARQHKCSLVFVTHPKKGRRGGVGMDDLAGGAAFQRFSQTILWLEHHREPRDVDVATDLGRTTMKVNRTMHVIKSRNGPGQGGKIGFNFCHESLELAEQGMVLPKEQ